MKVKSSLILFSTAFALLMVLGSIFFFNTPYHKAFGADDSDFEPPPPEAGPIDICGFAWSGTSQLGNPKMGAGWVSFNSMDCDKNDDGVISIAEGLQTPGCLPSGALGPVATGKYKVQLNQDNTLTGYAWSSNIGWIKFGGLNLGAAQTAGGQARVSGNNVLGWARACGGTLNPQSSCDGSRTDGWDGWISLSGVAANSQPYGVKFNSNKFNGSAWGGEVVGWLNWNAGSGDEVRYCSAPTLAATLTPVPATGFAPLNDVDMATQMSGTAVGTSTISYDCIDTGNDVYDAVQTNVVGNYYYKTDVCSYPSPGEYSAKIKVERAGLTAFSHADVFVTSNTPPPPPSTTTNVLGAVCDAEPKPARLNQEVNWIASIHPQQATQQPYTFTFTFMDGQSPDVVMATTTSPTDEVRVPRTYTTIGKKLLSVHVEDSNPSPNTAIGNCNTENTVIVRPTIIEI